MILSFVSFLATFGTLSQSFAQPVDEFEAFEAELRGSKPAPGAPPAAQPYMQPTNQNTGNAPAKPATNSNASEAQKAYDTGDYSKATALWWKQIEKLSRAELLMLARAHEKKKEPAEMIRALNILVGKDEKDAEAHYLLGNAYMLQKKPKEALAAYNTSLEINPRYEIAYLAVADMYEKRSPPNLYELRTIYQDLLEKVGDKAVYRAKICEINAKDGTLEAAVTSCRQAIQKDSQIPESHVYLGFAQKELGDTAAANQTLKKAADRFPQSELAQYHYGKMLEEKKNFPEALKYYQQGAKADPKSAGSWLGVAASAFELQKFDVSLEAYKKACRYNNKNAAAFRKATGILRNSRNSEWTPRFESAVENCTF